jgi:hypothetical protein
LIELYSIPSILCIPTISFNTLSANDTLSQTAGKADQTIHGLPAINIPSLLTDQIIRDLLLDSHLWQSTPRRTARPSPDPSSSDVDSLAQTLSAISKSPRSSVIPHLGLSARHVLFIESSSTRRAALYSCQPGDMRFT